mmetsp:Transcript_8242/g.10463  ORF Transcript_8242/g.10463 Transcript_8242/m.10463 type:complete len:381 (+) Transcript_8242:150-1292(+)
MIVTGIIIRRKSFGKFLAFATLKVLHVESDDGAAINNDESIDGIEIENIRDESIKVLKLVFQRKSNWWNSQFDDTFPTKNSLLPYGAKVRAVVCTRDPDKMSGYKQAVCSWEILVHPRIEAMKNAACGGRDDCDEGEGVLLSSYLESRTAEYLKYNDQSNHSNQKHSEKTIKKKKISTEETNFLSPSHHGDKKAKSQRAKLFARFLCDTFGPDLLKQHNGVLDIAGGKGQLSVELSILGQIPCTVIDPFIRGRNVDGKFLPNKEIKRIKKVEGVIPQHIARYFKRNEECFKLVEQCSCLAGLHPDQPTEDILDLAILCNKPFAIIPCCVYPGLFPNRKLISGEAVESYQDFIQYLLEKDDRLQTTTLNIEGKNRVIYLKL